MEGLTLLEYVQQYGPLSEEQARIVMLQLLEAIKRCHEIGILHRDIKLDNIMLRTADNNLNNIVLIDFGLSRFWILVVLPILMLERTSIWHQRL